jgi:hypothetical protein
MATSRSGSLESFVVSDVVLSFVILCGVNIPAIPAMNPYVLDVDTVQKTSFDACLQSCAQHSQRAVYGKDLLTFGRLCSAVTWDKDGNCWMKSGVTIIPRPATGPHGAISAILQYPAISAVDANANDNYAVAQETGVETGTATPNIYLTLRWSTCTVLGTNRTIIC